MNNICFDELYNYYFNKNIFCLKHKEVPIYYCSNNECTKEYICTECLIEDPEHFSKHVKYFIALDTKNKFLKFLQIPKEINLKNSFFNEIDELYTEIKKLINNNINEYIKKEKDKNSEIFNIYLNERGNIYNTVINKFIKDNNKTKIFQLKDDLIKIYNNININSKDNFLINVNKIIQKGINNIFDEILQMLNINNIILDNNNNNINFFNNSSINDISEINLNDTNIFTLKKDLEGNNKEINSVNKININEHNNNNNEINILLKELSNSSGSNNKNKNDLNELNLNKKKNLKNYDLDLNITNFEKKLKEMDSNEKHKKIDYMTKDIDVNKNDLIVKFNTEFDNQNNEKIKSTKDLIFEKINNKINNNISNNINKEKLNTKTQDNLNRLDQIRNKLGKNIK